MTTVPFIDTFKEAIQRIEGEKISYMIVGSIASIREYAQYYKYSDLALFFYDLTPDQRFSLLSSFRRPSCSG